MTSVALVHERFTDFAGSELVVQQFSEIWPDAPILAPIVDREVLPPGMHVSSGRVDRLYSKGSYAHLLPLLPWAMRHLPVPPVDVIVASHHAFANQVTFEERDTPVISYVHSPARWMWDPSMRHGEMGGRLGELALSVFSATQRGRDFEAAQRVHSLIANSSAVAARIKRWWGRESTVIFPPVDTDYYCPDPAVTREPFVLVAGRMVPYKHPEIAIAAAERAGIPIFVAGDGRAMTACRKVAGPHTRFVGRVSDAVLRDLYRRCSALVMPGEEDFGIVPVEAQGCGAPVVALGIGGALDTVVPNATGILVDPDVEPVTAIAQALSDALSRQWDHSAIVERATQFARPVFREKIRAHVARVCA